MLPVQNPDPAALSARRQRRFPAIQALRQPARLSIGVSGIAGGMLLLSANVAALVVSGGALSFVPLAANVALVFGGIMFLREYRLAARRLDDQAKGSHHAG